MSINIPIFTCGDNFQLNCFGCRKKGSYNRVIEELNDVYDKSSFDICILPINPAIYVIENLFPYWNHVQSWDIFIIGCDKTYIMAQVNSFETSKDLRQELPNRRGFGLIDTALYTFLEPIWDKTLGGTKLQFFMRMNDKDYLVNTFPMTNHKEKVIGAVLFMREFQLDRLDTGDLPSDMFPIKRTRVSEDLRNEMVKIHKHQMEKLVKQHEYEKKTLDYIDEHIESHTTFRSFRQ